MRSSAEGDASVVSGGALRAPGGVDSREIAGCGDWRGRNRGISGRDGCGPWGDGGVYRAAVADLFACVFFFGAAGDAGGGNERESRAGDNQGTGAGLACTW